MKIISIGSDRSVFDEQSAVRARQLEYGRLFDELHIIVFAKKGRKPVEQIGKNIWLYSTNSSSRFFYILDAIRIGCWISSERAMRKDNSVITCQDPFESGLVGWRVARRSGIRLHFQIHTDFANPLFVRQSFMNRLRFWLAKFLLRRTDGLRVVSARIADSLSLHSKKIKTVPVILPIYVDVKKIIEKKPEISLVAKYPEFDFLILMMSRLEPEKNIQLGLRAFKKVVSRFPNSGLVVVGSGSEEAKLREIVRTESLENNVKFEPWSNDPISYYKTADVFLSTSNFEGYGLSMVEAVLAGCRLVATDAGVAPDLSAINKCLLCPVQDEVCIAEKLFSCRENKVVSSDVNVQSMKGLIYEKKDFLEIMEKNLRDCLK